MGWAPLAVRPVAAGGVVSQQLAAVLILVAVHAQVLPVAPVGRVVVVITVLVVHGQEMQRVGIELARAFRTDPTVQRERALAIAHRALARRVARFAQQRVRVGALPSAPSSGWSKAPRRHGKSVGFLSYMSRTVSRCAGEPVRTGSAAHANAHRYTGNTGIPGAPAHRRTGSPSKI